MSYKMCTSLHIKITHIDTTLCEWPTLVLNIRNLYFYKISIVFTFSFEIEFHHKIMKKLPHRKLSLIPQFEKSFYVDPSYNHGIQHNQNVMCNGHVQCTEIAHKKPNNIIPQG